MDTVPEFYEHPSAQSCHLSCHIVRDLGRQSTDNGDTLPLDRDPGLHYLPPGITMNPLVDTPIMVHHLVGQTTTALFPDDSEKVMSYHRVFETDTRMRISPGSVSVTQTNDPGLVDHGKIVLGDGKRGMTNAGSRAGWPQIERR